MTYFADLSPFRYYDPDPYPCGFGDKVVSIGWIDKNENDECIFNKGKVSDEFLLKLKDLINDKDRKRYVRYCGWHECCLCGYECGGDFYIPFCNGSSEYKGISRDFLNENKCKIYVAPLMILHYIEKHNYCPPEEFINAVINPSGLRLMVGGEARKSKEFKIYGPHYEKIISSIDYRFGYYIKMHDLENPEKFREKIKQEAPWKIEHKIISDRISVERDSLKTEKEIEAFNFDQQIRELREKNPEEFSKLLKMATYK